MGSDPNASPQPDQVARDEAGLPVDARAINTHGGDYAEGSIDKRQGTFVQGEHVTVVAEEMAYNVAGLPNPYLGLRAFTYADRASFGGREALVRATVERITAPGNQHSLVFVTGASGSGKSSFVQAGLVPGLEAFYTRRNLAVQHATIRPGGRPIAALADGLLQLHQPPDASFAAARPFMVGVPSPPPTPNTVSVLVLDQLEEVFSPQCDPSQRDTLFAILAGLPPFEQLRMHIITTLRADFLPDLFGYPHVYDIAKQGVDLRAMRPEELQDAIQRPLQHAYPDKRFEPSLLQQLAADAAEDAAYLPLLQVSLEDLFRRGRLTRDQYDSLAHSLGERADAVQDYVDHDGQRAQPRPAEDRAAIIPIFLDLVRVSLDDDPRRDVRRRQPLSALLRGDAATQQRRLRLIRELAAARLLSAGAAIPESGAVSAADVEIDIVHESLIMRWERLRTAIAAQRNMLERRERFGQALAEWKEHAGEPKADEYLLTGVRLAEAEALKADDDVLFREPDAEHFFTQSVQKRDEARKRQLRRTRQVAAALALLALITVVAAVVAVQGQRSANVERATAIAERQRADLQAATAQAESQRADTQAATARAESQRADNQASTAVAATDLAQQRERIARVRELAAQARAVAEEYPQRGVLLAVEAVRLMQSFALDVPEAREALASGVASISGTPLAAGGSAILAHATSQDSHWAALASDNGQIVLLDLTAPDSLAQARV
ncbi:MAG TPA: hypothetical protein VFT99_22175, partial [Roseiflexaceae bacterium]|nr:hypothetical protein [Roseiflexaceae bacterium]